MTAELYYVVTPEIDEIDRGVREFTGYQEVFLYEILGNKPKLITSIEVDEEEQTEKAIEDYIEGVAPELFGDEHHKLFTLTQL